jgi:NhaP-type Na+/H+ or K+/H+ antiporter
MANALQRYSGFFNKATEDSMFSNVIDLLFNCACFIYIGMVIPFDEFSNVHNSVSTVPRIDYQNDRF